MAQINGEAEDASSTTPLDDSMTLGWKELYDDLQVIEYYPIDAFLVSLSFSN